MKKKLFIAVSLILIIFIGYLIFDQVKSTKEAENKQVVANEKLEKSVYEYLKASINLYYVSTGNYPRKISDMQSILEEKKADLYTDLIQAISKLSDFKYEVRGDDKAYRISYIDFKGNPINVEGSYDTEFHNYND